MLAMWRGELGSAGAWEMSWLSELLAGNSGQPYSRGGGAEALQADPTGTAAPSRVPITIADQRRNDRPEARIPLTRQTLCHERDGSDGRGRSLPGSDGVLGLRQQRRTGLFDQGRTAVPAERCSAAVYGAARATLAVDPGLGARQQALNLAQLRVGGLQLGGAAREDVQAIVVADGHLIGEPAEIPGELGHAFGELRAAAAQLGHRAAVLGGIPDRQAADRHERAGCRLAVSGRGGVRWGVAVERAHAMSPPQPVSIG